MTPAQYVVLYLVAGYALMGWMAAIDRHEAREAFLLSLFWPVTLVLLCSLSSCGAAP